MAQDRQPKSRSVAWTGALALAILMGIGRFAYTPVLPLMMHDGLIDLHQASVLAAANYAGYLVGALACMVLPIVRRRAGRAPVDTVWMIRSSLLATAALTAAMAIGVPASWAVLRFASGVVSAFGFVFVSTWCLERLAAQGAAPLGGVIYTGPGVGITLSGLAALAMVAMGVSAAAAWMVFGVLAAVLGILVWPVLAAPGPTPASLSGAAAAAPAASTARWGLQHAALTAAYGLAGFGYIITATFLPVIARETLPGSVWVDLFWPAFGLSVAAGALLTGRLAQTIDRRSLLAACYLIQAAGVLAPLVAPTVTGFLLGSALGGLPFTAITLFAMQEVRRLTPQGVTSFTGLMTASYGSGQIAGPALVAALLGQAVAPAGGFKTALFVAAGSLIVGAAVFLAIQRWYPMPRAARAKVSDAC